MSAKIHHKASTKPNAFSVTSKLKLQLKIYSFVTLFQLESLFLSFYNLRNKISLTLITNSNGTSHCLPLPRTTLNPVSQVTQLTPIIQSLRLKKRLIEMHYCLLSYSTNDSPRRLRHSLVGNDDALQAPPYHSEIKNRTNDSLPTPNLLSNYPIPNWRNLLPHGIEARDDHRKNRSTDPSSPAPNNLPKYLIPTWRSFRLNGIAARYDHPTHRSNDPSSPAPNNLPKHSIPSWRSRIHGSVTRYNQLRHQKPHAWAPRKTGSRIHGSVTQYNQLRHQKPHAWAPRKTGSRIHGRVTRYNQRRHKKPHAWPPPGKAHLIVEPPRPHTEQ